MDINLLRGLVTLAVIAAFLGIVWWAYRPAHKARFERDALLPFDETDDPTHGDKGRGL
jgi:cytochrome c oxidase cbb3-type subunit 4